MALYSLWHYLTGHLRITVQGYAPERFLNLCVQRGIHLWNIVKDGDRMQANIGIGGFFQIRPVARATASRVRILERRGFPFLLSRLKRRKGLLVGALMSLAALYLMTCFIWQVEVRGNEEVPEEAILEAARRAGLYPGVYKPEVDPRQVEEQILLAIRRIGWTAVEIRGTTAVIEVAERVLPPEAPPDVRPGDIVAAADGVVTRVLVFNGRALVSEGDTVVKGDVLITGRLADGDREGEAGPYVRARGIVRARVWHRAYEEVRVKEDVKLRTGRTFDRTLIKIGDNEIIIRGRKKIPFKLYEVKVERTGLVSWRNINLPVELIRETYLELVEVHQEFTVDEAERVAARRATDRLLMELPPHARVLAVREAVVQAGEGFVGVEVILEAEQDIGRFVPSPSGQEEGGTGQN